MDDEDATLVRDGCWRWGRGVGLERFELRSGRREWILRGVIVAAEPGGAVEARYRVACDDVWRTREAEATVRSAGGERRIHLSEADGRWTMDGQEVPALRGCVDVDLEWSPSTNTLPLRRLRLGASGPGVAVDAAWVRFPALTVERLRQEYTPLAPGWVRYASGAGGFTAELKIDEQCLVVDYADLWRRL